MSAVNVEEIIRGVRWTETEAVKQLFAGFRVVPIGRAERWPAGEWRRQYARQGITLSQADCLIAVAAHAVASALASGNPPHYPMSGIEVHHWPVGD